MSTRQSFIDRFFDAPLSLKKLLILCALMTGICAAFVATNQGFTSWYEGYLARERQEEEARRERQRLEAEAEAERQRAEAEAERKRQLQAKRAGMPRFTFSGISLEDSPQEIVKKSLADYTIATSFPVQQSGNAIRGYRNPDFGVLDFKFNDPLLGEFFSHHQGRNETRYGAWSMMGVYRYNLTFSDALKRAGLRQDVILLEEKTEDTKKASQILVVFYTFPGKAPQAAYLAASGDMIPAAMEVFEKRYGSPESMEEDDTFREAIWRSNEEMAVIWFDATPKHKFDADTLFIFSLPVYEKLAAFEKKVEADRRQREDMKKREERAKDDARRARI